MTTILAFVFVLGVLVFVHELGHFLAAKRVGIRVLKFQLGFNPTILSFRRGDTEYGIGALPLGGYVKMAGESPEDAGHRPSTTSSCRRRKWQRFQVLIMGPVMNLAPGIRAHGGRALSGRRRCRVYEDQPPVVGVVTEPARPPRGADIRPGDRIVGGRPARGQHLGTVLHRGRIEAGPRSLDRAAPQWPGAHAQGHPGALSDRAGSRSATSACCPMCIRTSASVDPGDPATEGGLKAGDVILAVNGQTIDLLVQLRESSPNIPNSR